MRDERPPEALCHARQHRIAHGRQQRIQVQAAALAGEHVDDLHREHAAHPQQRAVQFVEHFLAQLPKKANLTRRALERLQRYRWPGNVRQLENEIARAASLAEGPIDVTDLSPQVVAGVEEADTSGPEPLDLHRRVERLERGLLDEALRRSSGNQSEAARLLGLSRFGLQKKLQRYGMKL